MRVFTFLPGSLCGELAEEGGVGVFESDPAGRLLKLLENRLKTILAILSDRREFSALF